MLTAYAASENTLKPLAAPSDCTAAVWLDLLNPTKEEDAHVEQALGIAIPTREEMKEIEVSSRLYQEHGVHYLTATIVFRVDTPDPHSAEITFILTDRQLITVRYAEPRAIQLFLNQARNGDLDCATPLEVFIGLIEAVLEREADLIERLQLQTDRVAQTIFEMKGGAATRGRRFDVVLKDIGKMGETNSRVRESLVSLGRLLTYVSTTAQARNASAELRERIRTEAQDVQSLADHVSYLGSRLTFMLDASLGMVGIEQNQIIKLFSVVAVMLMPPTLVASIYGMNFKHMPELAWSWGYPMAIGLMVLSAVLPFLFFRHKGWL
ncbi:MAG: magnesium transporter CorA family protein [Hyphomicrobiaceae bacterium]